MKCLDPLVILISGEPLSWRRCLHDYGDGHARDCDRVHDHGRGHDDGRGDHDRDDDGRGHGRDDDFVCGHGEDRKALSFWSFYGLNNIYTYRPPVTYLLGAWCCSVKKNPMYHKSLYLLVKSELKLMYATSARFVLKKVALKAHSLTLGTLVHFRHFKLLF